MRLGLGAWLTLGLACGLDAGELPPDPLESPMWAEMHKRLLDGAPVVFDERVRVLAPGAAEDSLNVPVFVDASDVPDVQRLVVFAELNPIAKVLIMEPLQAPARIGLHLKVQQSTPVRAAALAADGTWHVGGRIVEAAGGGCTLPSVGSDAPDWSSRLGEVAGRLWRRDDGARLRFRTLHPMDTGLVAGIPAFYIESMEVRNGEGQPLVRLSLFEPVSENPLLTLDLPSTDRVRLQGRDNNGNEILAEILAESAP